MPAAPETTYLARNAPNAGRAVVPGLEAADPLSGLFLSPPLFGCRYGRVHQNHPSAEPVPPPPPAELHAQDSKPPYIARRWSTAPSRGMRGLFRFVRFGAAYYLKIETITVLGQGHDDMACHFGIKHHDCQWRA